jgi:hypothetical protein
MSNELKWIQRQSRFGLAFLVAGLVVMALGISLERRMEPLPFDARSVTAAGILLLGIATAFLWRYFFGRRNPQAAARLANKANDERYRTIHARAGNRAYWISLILGYLGLAYVSRMESRAVPVLSVDALWYYLAALVVFPFAIYIVSLVYDEKHR